MPQTESTFGQSLMTTLFENKTESEGSKSRVWGAHD